MTRENKSFRSPEQAIQFLADRTQSQHDDALAQIAALEAVVMFLIHKLNKEGLMSAGQLQNFSEIWEENTMSLAKTDREAELVKKIKENMHSLLTVKPEAKRAFEVLDGGKYD